MPRGGHRATQPSQIVVSHSPPTPFRPQSRIYWARLSRRWRLLCGILSQTLPAAAAWAKRKKKKNPKSTKNRERGKRERRVWGGKNKKDIESESFEKISSLWNQFVSHTEEWPGNISSCRGHAERIRSAQSSALRSAFRAHTEGRRL